MASKVIIVTFDIADQSFKKYSYAEWLRQVEEWKNELLEDGMIEEEYIMCNGYEEIVELMYGGELFFEQIEV